MKSGSLTELIEKAYRDEPARPFWGKGTIGASSIGNSCEAYLALSLRGFPDEAIDPQLKRIFRDGHKIEKDVLRDLMKAGISVIAKDEFTGKQLKWTSHGGHMVFKADGVIEEEQIKLLEIKSMNHALWTKFKGYGIKISHPHYYDQMQFGMGMSGIRECVMLAYNKDKSQYWDELIEFDPLRFSFLVQRGEVAMSGDVTRIGKDETDWRCRECPRRGACWNLRDVPKTVRTCANSYPTDGGWGCDCGGNDEKGCLGDYKKFEPKERK